MKLIAEHSKESVTLRVYTTGKDTKDIDMPRENIHYWYPFNVNFTYRYTNAKGYLYLVKAKSYTGPNVYSVDILKRTKELEKKDGVMFNPKVYERNLLIIKRAEQLGIIPITKDYNYQSIEFGFDLIGSCIDAIKQRGEERLLEAEPSASWENHTHLNEEWDTRAYSYLTEEENNTLLEFGEIYAMLTVMRKLVEGR